MKSEEREEHNKDDSKDGSSLKDPIPFDLTVEIITRLPVESLLKFQYVSKAWCSTIRSKDFIKSSVSRSSTPSPRLLISFRNGQLINNNAEKRLFFFTSSQEEDISSSLVANLDMTMASTDAYFYTRCASVNGFICLSHKDRFMVCNPSTRQVITLPEISGKPAYKFLGYDPVTDQYKAMCKKSVSNSEEDDQEHLVLTLGGNTKPSWRHIEGIARNYFPLTQGICINGFVYYGALIPAPYKKIVIVCFDVRSERLSFINFPSRNDIHWGEPISNLINYGGKLAYVTAVAHFDLWVLQDAKEHQWSRTRRIVSFRGDSSLERVPMSFQGTTKMGEIIVAPKILPRCLGPFYIRYYNVESNTFKKVKLEGVADDEDFRRRHGIGKYGNCYVYISQEDGPNFTFL